MKTVFSILLLSAISLAGLPLSAATVVVTAFGAPGMNEGSGTNVCEQTAQPSASCSIFPEFHDSTFRNTGYAMIQATAQFGSVSAFLSAAFDGSFAQVDAGYLAYFSDFVTITGGTGSGTFVSHFDLASSGMEENGISLLSPQFIIAQNNVKANPALHLIFMPGMEADVRLSVDVISTFDFGVPFWFGAGTQSDSHGTSTCCHFDSWSYTSSVTLTGYSVFDAQGNPVPNAVVRPTGIEGPNVFIPEPATWKLLLPFLLAVFAARRGLGSVK